MESNIDKIRLAALISLAIWNVIFSTHMKTPYPEALVELYALPATRLILLLIVLALSLWCPTVGALSALAYIALGADVIFLTK